MTTPDLSHIDRLTSVSRERSTSLEQTILDLSALHLGGMPGRLFIATLDLRTDLYYAPLTNIAQSDLATLRGFSPPILETIRSRFPVSFGGTGLLREALRLLEGDEKTLLMLRLDGAGRVTGVQESTGTREIVEATRANALIALSLQERANEGLESLRPTDAREEKWLIVRLDREIGAPESTGRTVRLAQVGALFLKKGTNLEDAFEQVEKAVQASSFATLVLLYEKERYYQKGLRQAVSGAIVKYGAGVDISKQVDVLRNRATAQRWNVPQVLDTDPEIEPKAGEKTVRAENIPQLAWYKMNRLTPITLMDLLVKTEGLQDYEVQTVSRACFSHLADTYWQDLPRPEPVNLRHGIGVALGLCASRVRECCEHMERREKLLSEGKPIKFPRGIDIFENRHRDLLRAFMPFVRENERLPTRISISLNGEGTTADAIDCLHPLLILQDLATATSALSEKSFGGVQLCPPRGFLHGDAHFGNFLVDASVPEDPLVFSIDPAEVKLPSEAAVAGAVPDLISEQHARKCLPGLSQDIVYDVAKMMMSTACGYGLAYRGGLRPCAKDGLFRLERPGSEGIRKLSDVGGISGSQIVAIDAPASEASWLYHDIAGKTVFRELCALFERVALSPEQTNFALSRLCLLTVRHAFSIADTLFPRDALGGVAMYLLGNRFLQRASAIVLRGIQSEFSLPTQQEWETVFEMTKGQDPLVLAGLGGAPRAPDASRVGAAQ